MASVSVTQPALLLSKPKGLFSVQHIPVPKPSPGFVLVKLHATALNPVDWKIWKYGVFIPEEQYPVVLGSDGAGEIVRLGEGVQGWNIGDRM
jgi:NADPH:quinone reductase-like Zn-dependent oxidoreductase